MKAFALLVAAVFSGSLMAATPAGDYLVKLAEGSKAQTITTLNNRLPAGSRVEDLKLNGWVHVKVPVTAINTFKSSSILSQPGVLAVQPNYRIKLLEDYKVQSEALRKKLAQMPKEDFPSGEVPPDNPALPTTGSGGSGADPLFSSQWGMNQIGVKDGWSKTKGNSDLIVAVIDTGVDYTHEDLVDNLWRNPKEIAGNNIDDDKNGYVDDIVGWDFASKDNKPYDFTTSIWEMLMGGGNPGHGTHCAGNVAARSDNGKGIAGVAPNVKIMALRFITEKGQGTTADAVAAIRYAVDNGARITSNSWGSEGEDPGDSTGNQALKDAIAYSQQKGVLFIAAAGNGHQGVGYNNDSDSRPAYPASYGDDIIISVAAIDESGNLGSFSNWGARSVDLGAPGVKVFSTMVANKYSDKVLDFAGMTANWDGTSMATPHVAGAAALYWSAHPEKSWQDVKSAVLSSVKRTSQLNGKTTSNGALDVGSLMRF